MAKLPDDNWSGLKLTQNRSLLVYPFTIADDVVLPRLNQSFSSLGQMSAADFFACMPGKISLEIDSAKPIWEPVVAEQAKKHLSPDLHPLVNRILHGENSPNITHHEGAQLPYRLRRDFLKDEFVIKLRENACKRLNSAGISWDGSGLIRFCFHDVKVHLLATGIGLLTMEIEINASLTQNGNTVSSDLLLEAIYALSHPESRGEQILHGKLQQKLAFEDVSAGDYVNVVVEDVQSTESVDSAEESRKRYGVRKNPAGQNSSIGKVLVGANQNEYCLVFHPGKMGNFSLGDIAMALLGNISAANNVHDRFFSFAYARCPEETPSSATRELAFRLSGNYNKDYAVCNSQVRKHTHALFQNIQFAAAIQGGAVVVSADPENSPMHLREYYKNSVKCSYIPLALLAYHEYLQLTRLLQRCACFPDQSGFDTEANHIKNNRDQLLNFRLYYRFSHVSNMSHHNLVHSTWRSALGLDTMLEELSKDVAEADNVYLAALQSQEDQRWHQQQEHWEKEKAQWRELEESEKKKEKAREKRWRWVGTVVAFLGSFTFIHELLEIFLRLEYPPEKWLLLLLKGDDLKWETILHTPKYASAVKFFEHLHVSEWNYTWAALGISIFAALVAFFKGPKIGHH